MVSGGGGSGGGSVSVFIYIYVHAQIHVYIKLFVHICRCVYVLVVVKPRSGNPLRLSFGHPEMIRALIEAGTDKDAVDDGNSAWSYIQKP